MNVRRIYPDQPGDVDVAAAYAYPDRPWLRLNMVASADGAAWFKGVSGELSGAADRKVFAVLRGLADVIVAGAGTVRTEGYGPVRPREVWAELREGRPATPPIAVITRGLALDLRGPLFTEAPPDAATIVLTCAAAPRERRAAAAAAGADVIVAGDDRVDMGQAVRALLARGLTRILCEGGPTVNGQLGVAGLIDELCLTVSPLLIGGEAARVLDGPAGRTPLRLAHVLEEDGFLFTRYTKDEEVRDEP